MDTSSKDNYLLNSVRISSNLVLERGSAELMQNNLDYKHIRSNVVKGILAVSSNFY